MCIGFRPIQILINSPPPRPFYMQLPEAIVVTIVLTLERYTISFVPINSIELIAFAYRAHNSVPMFDSKSPCVTDIIHIKNLLDVQKNERLTFR